MVRLQQSNDVKEIGHNHGDHAHDDGDLVLAVPGRGGLGLGGALHHQDDGVGGANQTTK